MSLPPGCPHWHPEAALQDSERHDTYIEYLQNLRIEAAKQLLESGQIPVDEISVEVSYEDPSFFRRLFKRSTGLTPSQYRRMFQPVFSASAQT